MKMKRFYQLSVSKLLAFAIVATLSTTASSNSSVWKISKNNDHVFIGGTIHVLPENEFPLPDEFIDAYKNTDQVVLEAQLPNPTDTAAQQAMLQKMSYTDGQSLKTVLKPHTLALLTKYFDDIGNDVNQFLSFKPGFVASFMAIIELQKADIAGEGVDAYFEELATLDNKKINYLETADLQFEMLGDLGKGYEDEFIISNLELNSGFKDFFQNTLDAWRIGDATRLEALINTAALESDQKSYDALFTKRNKNWIPKIEAYFTNTNKEFILVGAGHLFGKDGLLELLKSKGYTVEQKSS